MSDNVKLLEDIYKGAEMGRDSITQLNHIIDDDLLRRELDGQKNEYQGFMTEAEELMKRFGATPKGTGTMAKLSTRVMTDAKTMVDDSAPRVAEMMIQGSTMGVTKLTRHMSQYPDVDSDVRRLSERLISVEEQSIERLKRFL